MPERTRFPLLPRYKLYLDAPHGGGAEFARLFKETWRRLPSPVRQTVLAYWMSATSHFPDPGISLLPDWAGRPGENDADWVEATCWGARLTFSTSVTAIAPDDVVRMLIAHEIALVYQLALGDQSACDLVEEWGFMDSPSVEEPAAA